MTTPTPAPSVDVLAVMRRDHDHANAYREQNAVDGLLFSECHEQSEKARAAVSELLEVMAMYSLPLTGDYKRDCFEFGQEAVDRELRRRNALANCKPEGAIAPAPAPSAGRE